MLTDLFAICSPEKKDEMHLTPFLGTVQLRPSFKYLDKIDEKHKQATKKVSDEENKEQIAKQKAESEQKAKALQVWIYHPTSMLRLRLFPLSKSTSILSDIELFLINSRCKSEAQPTQKHGAGLDPTVLALPKKRTGPSWTTLMLM